MRFPQLIRDKVGWHFVISRKWMLSYAACPELPDLWKKPGRCGQSMRMGEVREDRWVGLGFCLSYVREREY